MKTKNETIKKPSKIFTKGGPPGPGRPSMAEQVAEIEGYLKKVIDKRIPLPLIKKLSKHLSSGNTKVFLDTLKLVIRLIPEIEKEVYTSPIVDELISKHMGLSVEDIEIIKDKSEFSNKLNSEETTTKPLHDI